MEENIIYTDGHGVRITNEKFFCGDKVYLLNGITRIDLRRIPASNLLGISLFVLGFVAIVTGSLNLFNNVSYTAQESIYIISGNMVAIGFGVACLIGGILRMILAKDRYAVEIGTAEGERRPFVTKSREHAAIIVASLKKAYYRFHKNGRGDTKKTTEKFIIS